MLIPAWLYTGLFYGLLGCTGVAVLYYAYRPKRDDEQTNLPRAEVAGRAWRRSLLTWLPRIGLLGVFGAWALSSCSVAVVKVTDGGGGRTAKRYEYLGTPSYTYAPNEEQPTDRIVGYDTWIVNESSRDVRVESFSYGRSLGWGDADPTVIPPGTAILTIGVDHIGPGDRPPHSVQVEGFEAKLGMSSRYWLTWDR